MAFEKFVAIATRHRSERGHVTHDAVLKGDHSGTAYQIDVLHRDSDSQSMGEAKDYSLRGGKVGPADVQKLVGALCDLDYIDTGVFWSATNYTEPARLYAEAAFEMSGKSITLMVLRPSTPEDESRFVRTIITTGRHYFPLVDESRFTVHWTQEGREILLASIPRHQTHMTFDVNMQEILDADGTVVTSLAALTKKGYAWPSEDNISRVCYWLPGLFMDANGMRVPILGIEYEMPFYVHTTSAEVTTTSPYSLVVVDENGKPAQVLTEANLQSYHFDEQKNVNPNA